MKKRMPHNKYKQKIASIRKTSHPLQHKTFFLNNERDKMKNITTHKTNINLISYLC